MGPRLLIAALAAEVAAWSPVFVGAPHRVPSPPLMSEVGKQADDALARSMGDAELFRRSSDLLRSGDKVTARQVVNALGRWKTRQEWNEAGIGRKGLLDDYRNGDYYEDDVAKMRTDFSQPMRYYIRGALSFWTSAIATV